MVAISIAKVEMTLDPRLVMVRTGKIAANRHAQGVTPVPGRPEGPAEPGVRAVGDDHVARPHDLGRTRIRAPDDRTVDDPRDQGGCDRLRRRPERGSGLHRDLGHHLVELPAPHDVAVGREVGVGRPRQFEGDPVRDRPQPLEALELRERPGETHVVELPHGPRGEPIAAGLLAREALLLDDEHPPSPLREPERGGGARRARADHENVVAIACAFVHSCLLEEADPHGGRA